MDEKYLMFIIAPLAVVLTILLLRWKFKRARTYMERYIEEHNLDAEIDKVGIPPLRLWLRNRKGDSWVRLKGADEKIYWARIRTKLLGGEPVDFFD